MSRVSTGARCPGFHGMAANLIFWQDGLPGGVIAVPPGLTCGRASDATAGGYAP